MKTPVRVAVTGAAGQIGYSLLFRIASGEMLGPRPAGDPADARAADRQGAGGAQGRDDGARGLRLPAARRHGRHGRSQGRLQGRRRSRCSSARSRAARAWSARTCCMENAKIFIEQGKALDAVASRAIKVLVVGNPANTNAYIAMKSAPSLPRENFTAMLRLDHNRALSQLAAKAGVPVGSIEKMVVWGNHSPTMYADYRFATVERQAAQGPHQRRGLEPQRVPAQGGQARRRHHRGARAVLRRLRRERRDRPRPRLGAGHERQVGDDGRAVATAATASRRTSCTAFR